MVEAQPGQATPVHVFYSYADEDQTWFKRLHEHMVNLRRSKAITDWHRGMLAAGAEQQVMVNQQLKQAAVVLPLISSAYLNSEYYTSELEWSLQRCTTDKLFRVVPVLVRPVDTHGLPFTRLQCVPPNGTYVTRWPDHDEALLEIVRSIRTTIESLQAQATSGGLMAPLVPTRTRPALFMAPEKPTELVERPQEFAAVKQGLLDRRRETPTAITTALEGTGGYGKTTLAIMLCHDPDVWSVFPDGILWVTLGQNPGSLIGKVEALVTALSNRSESFTTLEAATTRLTAVLAERDVLLVIDDVWNSDDLKPFLTEGKRSARLITTRIKEILPATTRSFTIDVMYAEEAVQVLSLGVERAVQTEQEQEALHALASQLGAWPLLLKLANAALREYVSKGGTLLTALTNVKMMLNRSGLVAYDVETARNRTQAVEATLQVNFELLTPAEYARFRELAIFPEDTDIPLATVQQLWGATARLDAAATTALCQRLHATSLLLDFNLTRMTIRLHDVIRTYLRTEASTELPTITARFLAAYDLPNWANLPSNEPYLWEHLAYHLLEAGRSAELVTTVKDLRYLACKTMLKETHTVEIDLLQAEQQAPTDATLRLLKRSYSQMSHLLNRYSTYAEVATVLHSRLLHLDDLVAACRQLEPSIRHPYLTPWHPLPDLPNPALIRILQEHTGYVTSCAVSPDGTWIVSAWQDHTLKIWDTRTGAVLHTLQGHTGEVYSCAVSPRGTWIVSAWQDHTLKIWDTRTGTLLHTLQDRLGVWAVGVSPDGTWIVLASLDGSLKIWDTRTRVVQHTLQTHSWLASCAVSPDGTWIVSASHDGTLKVWDARTSDELRTLQGHTYWVNDCAVSPDGTWIVSASWDNTLKVWNARTGVCLTTLHVDGALYGCAFCPDGEHLVAAGERGVYFLRVVR